MSANQEKLNEQLLNVVLSDKDSDEAKLKKVKYLVRLGADVNARLYGKSLLSKAMEQKAGAQVQDFLREKGANEWVISKEEALELSQGFWDENGKIKSVEEIKELLKKGADVNAKGKNGMTALIMGAAKGQLDVVKCLVEGEADLDVKNMYGDTALMKAALNGQLDVVKCLVEGGADLEAKDKDGRTALMIAACWGESDGVKCLVECGADLETKDKDGRTALMRAVNWGELELVKYLVENGVDVNTSDKYGQTALDIAKYYERHDCLKFLEEAQKKVSAQKTKGDKTGASQIVKKNEGR